jgi:hypothetical protein
MGVYHIEWYLLEWLVKLAPQIPMLSCLLLQMDPYVHPTNQQITSVLKHYYSTTTFFRRSLQL